MIRSRLEHRKSGRPQCFARHHPGAPLKPETFPSPRRHPALVIVQTILLFCGSTAVALDLSVTRTTWVGVAGQPPVETPPSEREKAKPDVVASFILEFPSLGLTEVETSEGRFTRLSMPGTGVSTLPGAPELPVYRRQLFVDPSGTYDCRTTVLEQESHDLAKFETPRMLLPARRAIAKAPGAREAARLGLDAGHYARSVSLPNEATVVDLGLVGGRRSLLVEFCPVTYDPIKGIVTRSKRVAVNVVRTGGEDPAALKAGTVSFPAPLPGMEPGGAKGAIQKRLLVVAADAFLPILQDFVEHRRAGGWRVDLVGTHETGSARESIRDHVRARYVREDLRPTHLLLVGDSDTIPAWPGQGAYAPDTDLYYACLDAEDDWLPDLACGRFPVRSTNQLGHLVDKIIHHEHAASNSPPFVSRAAFVTSSDNHALTEGTHNSVISRHMAPRNYACDLLYSYTHAATKSRIAEAMNAGRALLTYSGHAYAHMWRDPEMNAADVHALTNFPPCVLVSSFACDSGSFATMDECFAESWLRTGVGRGALAVLASSEDSYWEEDDILEKCLFAALFEDGERMLGNTVLRAKQRYLAHYGTGSETLQYFEQYNLLGDPTLTLAVPDGQSASDLVAATRELPDGCLGTNEVVAVTVRVHIGSPAPSALILKERLPPGWTISDARWNGTPMPPSYASGEHRWLFGVGTPVGGGTLAYQCLADGQIGGAYTITGGLLHGSTTVGTLGDQEVRMCGRIDSDGDGMPDDWEVRHGLSPSNSNDAAQHGDGDGLSNLEEYVADTNPTNTLSFLALHGITATGEHARISWTGGREAIQYLERRPNPSDAGSEWQIVHIATPPTPHTMAFAQPVGTNTTQIYRIRAMR